MALISMLRKIALSLRRVGADTGIQVLNETVQTEGTLLAPPRIPDARTQEGAYSWAAGAESRLLKTKEAAQAGGLLSPA